MNNRNNKSVFNEQIAISYTHLIFLKRIFWMFNDTVHTISYGEAMCPVVIRYPPIVFLYRHGESQQTFLIKTVQSKQISEHKYRMSYFFVIILFERIKVIIIYAYHLSRNAFMKNSFVFFFWACIMITQNFKSNL